MKKENHTSRKRLVPNSMQDQDQWILSRRTFVGSIITGGAATSFPTISVLGKGMDNLYLLSNKQISLISSVQKILFPSDKNGPGAYDVMADKYLDWVLSDSRMDPEEKEYIINGIEWVDETAMETFTLSYNELSQFQKEKLVSIISNENWGKSWLGVIVNFIFEALLSDPKYGGNTDEIGWDWLQHYPGFPRPLEQLLYPKILTTVSENQK